MVILDTDHASELSFRSAAGVRLLHRLDASSADAVVTAITVEEQMGGWLAEMSESTASRDVMASRCALLRRATL